MSARAQRARTGRTAVRALLAAALGVAAALLVSCSGSGAGLIPAANAGPLRGDFEAVVRAAESGNGKCSETESALAKTQVDFDALPATVSSELRNTLRQGIDNLKLRALSLCAQPLPQSTNTTTSTQTTPPPKTTSTPTTPTTTTPSTPTNTTPPEESKGGGTPPEESPKGGGESPPAGGAGEEAGKGGGQEAGK